MERVTFSELKELFDNWNQDSNEKSYFKVNAEEYIQFNIQPEGFLSSNDDEYLDAFQVYAECNNIEVWDIEENLDEDWGVIISEPYPFAMPLDGEIDYEIDEW